jgi:hypothetical protein
LHAGKLHEVELSRAGDGSSEGRKFSGADEFLNSHRDLLPEYSKSVRVGEGHEGAHKIETYQLVDKVSMPVAKVQFRLDGDSRLLGLRVVTGQEVPSN